MQGRILIVDDSLMVRESYTELLRGRGYTVEQASDGEEALELIRTQSVDLAIVDVMMPTKGGIKFRQRLNESSSGRNINSRYRPVRARRRFG